MLLYFEIWVHFALRLVVSDIQQVQGWRNWKYTEWPQTELEDLTVKSTLYALNIFARFALGLAVSEIQGHQKSKMHRMTPNWTSTLNSQNYSTSIYTRYLPLRTKFWSVSLSGFQYCTFCNSPLTTMLNVPPPKKKKKKSKCWSFRITPNKIWWCS